MCGRYALYSGHGRLVEQFALDADRVPTLPPRYNIAPSQAVSVVRIPPGYSDRVWDQVLWGLIPSWVKDPKTAYRSINAKAKTVASKPSFKSAFRCRRCLIPADGFYEWKVLAAGKQPYYIHMQDEQPFAFAGLWECWQGDGRMIESCTIITTTANELVETIHDRMPVILPHDAYDIWLDPSLQDPRHLLPLLRSCPASAMLAYPVARHVNNPKHDDTRCINRLTREA